MKTKFLIIVSAALVVACGGGGSGSSTPTSTTPPNTTPTVTPANLQSTVAPANYTNQLNTKVFNIINNFRKEQGLGLWKQSTNLDASTEAHNKYCELNQCFSHTEDSGKPGYTGATPSDRAIFANYGSTSVGEVASSKSYFDSQNAPEDFVNMLLNSVYHRAGLMTQRATDVGINFFEKQTSVINGQPLFTGSLYINYGFKSLQNNAGDFITVYPRDNQTDIPLYMNTELPNPVSDLPVTQSAFAAGTSAPISLMLAESVVLKVESYKVTNSATGQDFPVRLLTYDTDKLLTPNALFLIGKQPFSANTKYCTSAVITGNGTRISKNWCFTTGTKTPF